MRRSLVSHRTRALHEVITASFPVIIKHRHAFIEARLISTRDEFTTHHARIHVVRVAAHGPLATAHNHKSPPLAYFLWLLYLHFISTRRTRLTLAAKLEREFVASGPCAGMLRSATADFIYSISEKTFGYSKLWNEIQKIYKNKSLDLISDRPDLKLN